MPRLPPFAVPAAAAALALGALLPAASQTFRPAPPAAFDTSQLPEFRGVVARYTLSPRGDVDGLILQDGTQVHLPPHLSTQLVYTARPGDAVTVRGLRGLGFPMIAAVSVRNDASGSEVIDTGAGPRGTEISMEASGEVQTVLRGPRGEVNGAILADGTTVRLPPESADRLSEQLQVGATLAVRGEGRSTVFGRVIEASYVGPSLDRLTALDRRGPRDRPPPPRPPRG